MNVLIELLKQIDFRTLDIDKLLDNRDADMADAKLLGYEDPWLNKLSACYENRTIPCGSL